MVSPTPTVPSRFLRVQTAPPTYELIGDTAIAVGAKAARAGTLHHQPTATNAGG